MKQTLTLLLCILCSITIAIAQTTYPNGATGCIARYNFSSNGTVTYLKDVSGNGNDGTVTSLVAAPGFRNWTNKAYKFNGLSSAGHVPSSNSLSPNNSITMLALVQLNSFYSGSCQGNQILLKGNTYYVPGVYGMCVSDQVYDGDCGGFHPQNEQLNGQMVVTSNGYAANPPVGNYIGTGANKWYFMAVSFDGSVAKYYQTLMDTFNFQSTLAPFYSSPVIGSSMGGSNNIELTIGATTNPSFLNWWNGSMDEVVLFNRALNDSEVHSVYEYLWTVVKMTGPFAPSHMCPKDSFIVFYTTNDTLMAGNIFTVELSDAAGSFATPYVLNSKLGVLGDSMLCYLPYNLPNGAGYRYRVVSSLPHFASKDNGFDISVGGPVVNVTVSPNNILPSVQTVTFTATVTNAGAAPLTYQWYVDNMPITGATNATFTNNSYVDLDSFSVRVAAATGFTCNVGYSPYTTMHIDTTISTSVNNTNMTSVHISTAPNPNKGSFTIEGINHNEAAVVEIYTTTGSKVYSQTVSGNSAVSTDLPSGMYLLRVTQASTTTVLKMMIER